MKPNKPLDCAIASLLDTAYLHPRLQHSFLPWWAYDCFVKGMFWLISGTTTGIDQWAGRVEDDFCVDSLFFVKSNRVIPYISAPHRPRSLGERIRSFLINIPVPEIPKDRIVKVATWPTKLDKDGILHFAPTDRPEKRLLNSEGPDGRGSWAKPDVIIMANGYQQTFPFLPTDGSYKTAREVDTHGIYDSTDVSLGYIGIVRPSVGAIPPLAEMQTLVWTHRLLRSWYPSLVPPVPSKSTRDVIAPYKLSYRLRPRAMRDMAYLKYGVDHESYAYQLALEAGAAPTIWWVLRNGWFKLAYVWAFGPNFNPKHRLVGPWKWAGMPKSAAAARPNKAGMIVNPEEVMKGELWNVVKRSGGFVCKYKHVPDPRPTGAWIC